MLRDIGGWLPTFRDCVACFREGQGLQEEFMDILGLTDGHDVQFRNIEDHSFAALVAASH